MIFKNFIELNSTVAKGFIINDIISVLHQEGNISEEKEEGILQNAIIFINLIKKGFEFLSEEKPIQNLEKSLNAFNIAYYALKDSEDKIRLSEIKQIINSSLDELKNLVKYKDFNKQNLSESFRLFKSMRAFLFKRAQDLSIKDEYPLEI